MELSYFRFYPFFFRPRFALAKQPSVFYLIPFTEGRAALLVAKQRGAASIALIPEGAALLEAATLFKISERYFKGLLLLPRNPKGRGSNSP
jgi:hypothetical protein